MTPASGARGESGKTKKTSKDEVRRLLISELSTLRTGGGLEASRLRAADTLMALPVLEHGVRPKHLDQVAAARELIIGLLCALMPQSNGVTAVTAVYGLNPQVQAAGPDLRRKGYAAWCSPQLNSTQAVRHREGIGFSKLADELLSLTQWPLPVSPALSTATELPILMREDVWKVDSVGEADRRHVAFHFRNLSRQSVAQIAFDGLELPHSGWSLDPGSSDAQLIRSGASPAEPVVMAVIKHQPIRPNSDYWLRLTYVAEEVSKGAIDDLSTPMGTRVPDKIHLALKVHHKLWPIQYFVCSGETQNWPRKLSYCNPLSSTPFGTTHVEIRGPRTGMTYGFLGRSLVPLSSITAFEDPGKSGFVIYG